MKFRIEKKDDYTVISNICIRDKSLSLKAKGLHTLMMSLPDDWDYSISGLASICKESDNAIRTALKELEDAFYLKRERYNKGGKFDYIYNIYETPHTDFPHTETPHTETPHTETPHTEISHTEIPHTETPHTEIPHTENVTQLNKDKLNKDKPNKEEAKIARTLSGIKNINLQGALSAFIEMRKETKRPVNDTSLRFIIKKLSEMSDTDSERIAILEQSTRNGWKDIYALKDKISRSSPPPYAPIQSSAVIQPTDDIAAIEAAFAARIMA